MSFLWSGSTAINSYIGFSAALWFGVKEYSVYCACTVPWDPCGDMTRITAIRGSLRQLHKAVPWTFLIMAWLMDVSYVHTQGCGPLLGLVTFKMFWIKNPSLCCDNEIRHLVMFVCVSVTSLPSTPTLILLSEHLLSHSRLQCYILGWSANVPRHSYDELKAWQEC